MNDLSPGWIITLALAGVAVGGAISYAIKHEGECTQCGAQVEKGPLEETLLGFSYLEHCPQCGFEKRRHLPNNLGDTLVP